MVVVGEEKKNKPCFCMTIRNLMMTLEEGLIMTCLLPRFSALYMLLSASLSTLILTIFPFPPKAQALIHNTGNKSNK